MQSRFDQTQTLLKIFSVDNFSNYACYIVKIIVSLMVSPQTYVFPESTFSGYSWSITYNFDIDFSSSWGFF